MSDFLDRMSKLPPKKLAILAMQLQQRVEALERARPVPLAVIGIGCRFPGGVSGPDDFWRLLAGGVDAISDVPADRWNIDAYFDPDPDVAGKMCSRSGGFIADVDRFDPLFFGIAPREAMQMDPQHRLVLEVAWEALEHAGVPPDALAGSRAGVFLGITASDYVEILRLASAADDAHSLTGNGISFSAGRVSYTLGLHGPSLAVDTACSSSLVAVHLACQSLRLNECRLALAGGVNLILSPSGTIATSRAHMLAPDGRCKTFDAAADGYVRSEGCGIVALKRADDAIADGDRIIALIRGSAINQDGRTSGLTVPSGPAQQSVIRLALADAAIAPADVGYIEAHGTGTSLGDPIEMEALRSVFGPGRSGDRPLVVGAVKTNLGHLESAAGIASLIKVVLMLQHGTIPSHLHFKTPNPLISLREIPAVVPTQAIPWPPSERRIAGVSSFGASGTNAHIVLEEAPPIVETVAELDRPIHLLTLSGRTPSAAGRAARRLLDCWTADPTMAAADVAYTHNAGRQHFGHRIAVVGRSANEFRSALHAFVAGDRPTGVYASEARPGPAPKIVFVLGDRMPCGETVSELYQTQPTFRDALDACDRALAPMIGRSIAETVRSPRASSQMLASAEVFALQYATMELWRTWGVTPAAVVGSGIGECAAAWAAGLFDLDTAARFAAARDAAQIGRDSGEAFQQLARASSYSTPRIGIASARTGRFPAREVVSQEYWTESTPASPGLANALSALGSEHAVFVECGAAHVSWAQLLTTCAQLYVRGASINWAAFDADYRRRKVSVPTYPFERERYWVDLPDGRSVESPVARADQDEVGRDMYSLVWREKGTGGSASTPADPLGLWLIFDDRTGVGVKLAARIAAAGGAVLRVIAGAAFRHVATDAIEIDPLRADDYDRLLREAVGRAPFRGIVHLWSLDSTLPSDSALPAHAVAAAACSSVANSARILSAGTDGRMPRLWLVTRGAQATDLYAGAAAAQAPVWGLGRALAIEQPALRCVRVDLDPAATPSDADLLWSEMAASDEEDQIAYRGPTRRVARLVRTSVAGLRGRSLALNPDATYLITGGAGGLGRCVAEWMIERGARSVALVGRRAEPAGMQSMIDRLGRTGARVTYYGGDVSRPADVATILRSMAGTLPPLRGIVHASGVLDDGLLAGQSWPQLERVLAPKMSGAWNLHAATGHLPLDFFVLFSSGASLIGSAGQANYAAANAFLDALAHERRARGLPGIAINWGPWAGVGMAAATDARARDRWTSQGWSLLPPSRALAALERLLVADPPPQVAVMSVDWKVAFTAATGRGLAPLFAELADPDAAAVGAGDFDPELLRKATPERRGGIVAAFVRDEILRALRVPPSAMSIDTPLTELGMDSLMALELRNRIQAKLGVALPLADLVGGLSSRGVIDAVRGRLEADALPGTAVTADIPDAPALLERIPELSDEEVDALLARIVSNESRVS